MAEWSVKPQWKKSIIERSYYHKDGATVIAETGWRWGEFTVYTDDDNPPDIESGVDIYNCDYETELVETTDSCWEEVTIDDPEQEEWLSTFLEENSYLDLEEHGWMQGDTEMIIDCDLLIERVDGEVAPALAPIVDTVQMPVVEVNGKVVDLFKDDKPMYAPKPNGNKWPFETGYVPSKPEEPEEPEMTDWFPASINPVRVGHYEILTKESINWPYPNKGYWDGKKWNFLDHTVEEWRGLAKDPGAK